MEDKEKSGCKRLEFHDCYAEDTKITMLTYEAKAVKDIQVGDYILGMNDKHLVVGNVIHGFESEICHITAENGCEIRVSKDHILKKITEESSAGKDVCAKELQVGDVILSLDGAVRITDVQIEAYDNTVYNLEFQDETMPNFILADGFWAQQMNRGQSDKEETEKLPRDIQEEFEKLGSLFNTNVH